MVKEDSGKGDVELETNSSVGFTLGEESERVSYAGGSAVYPSGNSRDH